ncbi:predicted protein [Plenodomus lingam JN3]|uniref:Predicted protein n=1 Tax=Leptosphaeria maculans (strain JN3 / isolate v23.1.3 / race Av1-4-5-6-7-8) TaxID=985895 RepID=E4ZPG9_LEPMJ|nr:predicted protein [Plenodomus lingam JN3]CBX93194.1 predicted protein [Plenodomus lingam JN3]
MRLAIPASFFSSPLLPMLNADRVKFAAAITSRISREKIFSKPPKVAAKI